MKLLQPWLMPVGFAALAATACGSESGSGDPVGTTGFPGASTGAGSVEGTTTAGPGTAGSGTTSGTVSTTGSGAASTAGSVPTTSGTTGAAPGTSTTGAPTTGGAGATDDGGVSEGGTGGADAMAGGTGDCDRACLLDFMQQYVDALEAQDPAQLPISDDLAYSENGVAADLGQSVWQGGVSVQSDARLDFADPVERNVATQLWFKASNGVDTLYQVRLKVEEHQITEIESMSLSSEEVGSLLAFAEVGTVFFKPEALKPEAIFLEPVQPADRMSRDELLSITELYLDYLEGTGSPEFDEGCKRYENGEVTASGGRLGSEGWGFDVTRRILIVDEEAQITWGMFPFDKSEKPLVVGEAFKIMNGKIMMIQAVMRSQPVGFWQ